MMKLNSIKTKFIALFVATLCSTFAFAEGYQINSQSTRQLGMGHTGVALKLGSESMHFNPAGMAFMESKFDFSFGGTAIKSKVDYTNNNYKANTDNPLGTPIFGFFGYKPCNNLAVGVSITNPAGNSIKWPDNWAGSTLVEEISLKGFAIQPTASYKFSDRVSVGAGLMIDFGNFSLSRALIPVGGLNPIGQMVPALAPAINSFQGQVPLSATLSGNAKIGLGVNLGVLINISEKVSLGASFKSTVKLKVNEGEADLNYANEAAKEVIATVNKVKPGTVVVPPLDEGTFTASLPIPHNINVGVSYKPTKKLTLTSELQFVGWQAYDTLTVQFDQSVLNGYSIKATKGYKNTVITRIGAEYTISKVAIVRLGGYYDTTPVRDNLYNPETPGSNKIAITGGATLSPTKFMDIDLALAYVKGGEKYGSYPNPSTTNPNALFDGYYKARAFMASFGLRFKF